MASTTTNQTWSKILRTVNSNKGRGTEIVQRVPKFPVSGGRLPSSPEFHPLHHQLFCCAHDQHGL